MAEYIKIIILAILQGIAEFLPISSSGHLLIVSDFLQWNTESGAFINILLHGGTLLSIVLFYHKLLLSIVKGNNKKLIVQLIIGTIPIVIIGLLVKKTFLNDIVFSQPLIAGFGFLFSGWFILWSNKKYQKNILENGEKSLGGLEKLSYLKAFYIGLLQSVAILPGISRSGSTISMGLQLKLKREDCAKFSFLLAIPAIAGAVAAEIIDILRESVTKDGLVINNSNVLLYTVGFLVAFVVGYFSLKFLLKTLQKGKFQYFSYYLFVIGVVTVVYSLIKLLNS